MRRAYKYIKFNLGESGIWWCSNKKNGTLLGSVSIFEAWKQYCFFPFDETVLNATCLQDVIHFLGQLNGGMNAK